MESDENNKEEPSESVTIILPRAVLEFAEFYAELGSVDRDILLRRILTERLQEIKNTFKSLPYIDIPELW